MYQNSRQWVPEAKTSGQSLTEVETLICFLTGGFDEVINMPVWYMITGKFEDPEGLTGP